MVSSAVARRTEDKISTLFVSHHLSLEASPETVLRLASHDILENAFNMLRIVVSKGCEYILCGWAEG